MIIPLNDEEITQNLNSLNGWIYADSKLTKSFEFLNFRDAVAFIMRLSFEAEQSDHHPEINNCYNRVAISLCTHDAGSKVTEKDFSLAKAIEKLFSA